MFSQRHNFMTRLALASALAIGLGAGGIANAGHVDLFVRFAPPMVPDYVLPMAPGFGYTWVPGYWAYDDADGGYYWVDGQWEMPPFVGALWTPGYWGPDTGGYIFHRGYWGNQVGYYGGINFGFGYSGRGYSGGRWDGGRFHTYYYNQGTQGRQNSVTRSDWHGGYYNRGGNVGHSHDHQSYVGRGANTNNTRIGDISTGGVNRNDERGRYEQIPNRHQQVPNMSQGPSGGVHTLGVPMTMPMPGSGQQERMLRGQGNGNGQQDRLLRGQGNGVDERGGFRPHVESAPAGAAHSERGGQRAGEPPADTRKDRSGHEHR